MSNQLIFFIHLILLQVEKPTLIGGLFFVIIQAECPIKDCSFYILLIFKPSRNLTRDGFFCYDIKPYPV